MTINEAKKFWDEFNRCSKALVDAYNELKIESFMEHYIIVESPHYKLEVRPFEEVDCTLSEEEEKNDPHEGFYVVPNIYNIDLACYDNHGSYDDCKSCEETIYCIHESFFISVMATAQQLFNTEYDEWTVRLSQPIS